MKRQVRTESCKWERGREKEKEREKQREKVKEKGKAKEAGRNTNGTNVLMRNFLKNLGVLHVRSTIHCWCCRGRQVRSVRRVHRKRHTHTQLASHKYPSDYCPERKLKSHSLLFHSLSLFLSVLTRVNDCCVLLLLREEVAGKKTHQSSEDFILLPSLLPWINSRHLQLGQEQWISQWHLATSSTEAMLSMFSLYASTSASGRCCYNTFADSLALDYATRPVFPLTGVQEQQQ